MVRSVKQPLAGFPASFRWLLVLLAVLPRFGGAQEPSHSIYLNTGRLDTAAPAAFRQAAATGSGQHAYLIQFAGPIQPEWHTALRQTGVQILHYIPDNTYLVAGDAAALARAQRLPAVQWHGAFRAEHKVHPRARHRLTDEFAVQLLDDPAANAATLALLDRLKLAPVRRQSRLAPYVTISVRLLPEDLDTLASQPDVISIHPYAAPRKLDERQDQIVAGNLTGSVPSGPGYLAWLASKGFTQAQFEASGFVVDISDSGIDNGTTQPGHFALYPLGDTNQASRVAYNRLEGVANFHSTLAGCDGHGNLNTHIVAGYADQPAGFPHTDAAGFAYGLGVCPFVKVGSSVIFDPDNSTYPDYPTQFSAAYRDGARISNNSWGNDISSDGQYDSDAQAYDALVRDAQPAGSPHPAAGNQEMIIVFSAGNDGPGANTITSPGTAKNVITVGAAANVRSLATANGGNDATGADGCSTADDEASSANDLVSFTSQGPCNDGRIKPDLVAPGSHITGGAPQSEPPPTPAGTGAALACYLNFQRLYGCFGFGVCALADSCATSANDFFPLGQEFYTVSSGTSHAAPVVSGACALLRQFFINHGRVPPSPAMTKAWLLNSARYLTGAGANDTLPSANQGLGEINLGMAFDEVPRLLRDQLANDKFTASGQTRQFAGTISDPTQPVRVTLAWTDAPGSTVASRVLNNDLDLTVTIGGVTYKGNVFSGANSIAGGAADRLNNVESVFLPAGTTGSVIVTVTATNINSDGVPGDADPLDQDFALVIYNYSSGPDTLGVVTTSPLPAGRVRTAYHTALLATNGLPPYTWAITAGGLPGGLQLSDTGVITGIPTTAGTTNFTAQVTDNIGFSTTVALSLMVSNAQTAVTPVITPAGGTVADYVRVTLSCRTAKATMVYTTDGTEPTRDSLVYRAALILSNSATLKAQAVKSGYNDSATATVNFTITTPAITNAPALPAGVVHQTYRVALQAIGGAKPYRWSVINGSLPPGLKLSSAGIIAGKPTIAGPATFTAYAIDVKKGAAQQEFSLQVNALATPSGLK